MDLLTARTIVRNAARSGNDDSRYTATQIDIAIRRVGNDFVNRTACTLQVDAIAFTADTPEISLTALVDDGFRPNLLLEARIDESADYEATSIADNLAIVALREVRNERARNTSSAVPLKLAFLDWDDAELWPAPKADGTLSVWWRPPFTTFTLGVADNLADDVILNIPADLIDPVLDMAAVILQITEPEAVEKQLRSGFYDEHVRMSADAGGRGERSAMAEE